MSKEIRVIDLQPGDCIVDNPKRELSVVLEKPSCHTADWATVLGTISLDGVIDHDETVGYRSVEIISRIADPETGEEIFF